MTFNFGSVRLFQQFEHGYYDWRWWIERERYVYPRACEICEDAEVGNDRTNSQLRRNE